MRGEKSDPPALAIWLLRHLRPGRDSEALSGDLLETFAERRSRGWLWRQVLIAIAMGPHIGYAIAGTAAAALTGYGISPSPAVVRWRMLTWALPWPWPGVVFDSGLATLYVSVICVGDPANPGRSAAAEGDVRLGEFAPGLRNRPSVDPGWRSCHRDVGGPSLARASVNDAGGLRDLAVRRHVLCRGVVGLPGSRPQPSRYLRPPASTRRRNSISTLPITAKLSGASLSAVSAGACQ